MDYQNLDEHFRQRLYHVEVPPPPAVWNGVEKTLHERRRRWAFAWIFGSSLTVAGIAIALWTTRQTNEMRAASQSNFSEKTTAAAPLREAATTMAAAQPLRESSENVADSGRQFTAKSGGASASAWPKKLADRKIPDTQTAVHQAFGDDKPPVAAPVLETQRQPETTTATVFAPLQTLPPRPPSVSAQPPYRFAPITPLWRKKKEAQRCYSFANYRPTWMLEGYTGYAHALRQLEANGASSLQYAARRDETERFAFGMTGGLRGTLVWGPFVVRTGLHYTHATEVFENEQLNSIRTIIVIDSALVNGRWVREERTVREYGSKFTRTYNRLNLLDVPLLVGAELRFGRGGLSLSAGGAANLLFSKTGTVLAPNSPADGAPIMQSLSPMLRARAGFSLMGTAQAFWHLSPKTRVFAEPYFQHILKSVSTDGQPVSQCYNIVGANFGIARILD